MSVQATVVVRGLDEIQRKLQSLTERVRRRHLKTILERNTEPVVDEAIRHVPSHKIVTGWLAFLEDPGSPSLKSSIGKYVMVSGKKAMSTVGVKSGKGNARHGHLVEFGHRIVIFGKDTGRRTRKFPFMRKAYDYKSGSATTLIIRDCANAVEKEATYGG